jgi:hypothetical protein
MEARRRALAEFWTQVAADPRAWRFGIVHRGTLAADEIAEQISTDIDHVAGREFEGSVAVFVNHNACLRVLPANDERNSEGGHAEYLIRVELDSSVRVEDLELPYQGALTWIYGVGGRWVADEQSGLDPLVLTSLMLTSALRVESTWHMQPFPQQRINNWIDGDFENNLAALAERESEITHEQLPELVNYAYDAVRGRIVDSLGQEVQPDEIQRVLERGDPDCIANIGPATIARALATRSTVQGHGDHRHDGGVALRDAAVRFGEMAPL